MACQPLTALQALLAVVAALLAVAVTAVKLSLSAFNWSRNSDELTNEFAAGFVGSNGA